MAAAATTLHARGALTSTQLGFGAACFGAALWVRRLRPRPPPSIRDTFRSASGPSTPLDLRARSRALRAILPAARHGSEAETRARSRTSGARWLHRRRAAATQLSDGVRDEKDRGAGGAAAMLRACRRPLRRACAGHNRSALTNCAHLASTAPRAQRARPLCARAVCAVAQAGALPRGGNAALDKLPRAQIARDDDRRRLPGLSGLLRPRRRARRRARSMLRGGLRSLRRRWPMAAGRGGAPPQSATS